MPNPYRPPDVNRAKRTEDRARVTADINAGRIGSYVAPTTTPVASSSAAAGGSATTVVASSSTAQVTADPQTQTSKKRKRPATEEPQVSASSSSASLQRNDSVAPPATQIVAEEDLDAANNEQAYEADEVYVAFPTKIVGVQYYRGMVGAGELVSVVREPTNRYDSNAIRVLNASETQVGHLPRPVAAKLAPLMDQGRVSVEGVMKNGNMSGRFAYDLAMTLNICGPSNPARRRELEPLLFWATPGQRGFNQPPNQTGVAGTSLSPKKGQKDASAAAAGPSNGASQLQQQQLLDSQKALELSRMMAGLAKVDDSARRATVLDALCGEDILELPLHEDPPSKAKGQLKNDLLRHQLQGLRWCIEHESPALPKTETAPPVQFWQFKKNGQQAYYFNIATKTPQSAVPAIGRGAIMADSMGLGKTLTMLSLIIATLDDVPSAFSNATLIVVPLSVLSNWTTQIDDHVTEGTLRTYVYHGDGRAAAAEALGRYDVVITTYETVSRDWKGSKPAAPANKKARTDGGLFGVKWKRIILDEGHNIRNPKTKTSQALCELEAERRWVVTGTPIINSPNDLGSLLKFLKVCTPLDQHEYFNRLLGRPLSKADPQAAVLLKALMSSICLRRTKEMRDKDGKPLVPLPPVEVTVVRVALNDQERRLYDDIFHESQRRFEDFLGAGNATHQPAGDMPMAANVLSMLTRLRQLVLHPSLIPANYLEDLRKSNNANDAAAHPPSHALTGEEVVMLQATLWQAIQDAEECSICFDVLNNPRILPCSHYFCFECIREVISRQQKCPMDRGIVAEGDLIEPPPPPPEEDFEDDEEADYDALDNDEGFELPPPPPPSSKIQHLISLLQHIPSTEKSLVFSQFTSFLDQIAVQLDLAKIPYARFDGSMPQKQRAAVLKQFAVPLKDPNETESEDEFPVQTRRSKGKGKASAIGRAVPQVPVVMLISLKAGALGLNLTAASRVFLMDPWWQSAIELQAIDRVNRIGQTKDVHVYQMVADDTVETRVLAIQERKQLLVEQDQEEYDRWDIQHDALREAVGLCYQSYLGDLIPQMLGPRADGSAPRVVDIGTGSGKWAIEIAEAFPHAEVLGIDYQKPPMNRPVLVARQTPFEQDDVNLRLGHYVNYFDIIHARAIDHGIDDYPDFLYEMARILRPGGIIMLFKPSMFLFQCQGKDERGEEIFVPMPEFGPRDDPPGYQLQKVMSLVDKAMKFVILASKRYWQEILPLRLSL
ncbi:hypothetical protein FRC04_009165 [Tulasnella sp. 424]|nr:hypothetical protein FRC04_009165 [Tulasnella sp. 424]KAG8973415.1 hypothetical protein FRC05_008806 [Tulasnella sp. 425]